MYLCIFSITYKRKWALDKNLSCKPFVIGSLEIYSAAIVSVTNFCKRSCIPVNVIEESSQTYLNLKDQEGFL